MVASGTDWGRKDTPSVSFHNPKRRRAEMETYFFGDKRSIKKLTPNKPGERLDANTYLDLLNLLIKRNNGVVSQAQLVAKCQEHFRNVWSQDDLKPVLVAGRYPRAKWLNVLD